MLYQTLCVHVFLWFIFMWKGTVFNYFLGGEGGREGGRERCYTSVLVLKCDAPVSVWSTVLMIISGQRVQKWLFFSVISLLFGHRRVLIGR